MHSRLWALSFGLNNGPEPEFSQKKGNDALEDCFKSAVECCESVVQDLLNFGEPLYFMMTPM